MEYGRVPWHIKQAQKDYERAQQLQKITENKMLRERLVKELQKVQADENYFDRDFYIASLQEAINRLDAGQPII